MEKTTATNAMDLVDRLGTALAGTEGRKLNLGSLRSLVAMEVEEWRADTVDAHQPIKNSGSKTYVDQSKD